MTIYGWRIPPVFSLLIWIGLWEIIGQLKLAFILPPFSSVVGELSTLISRPDFQSAALQTLESFAIGMTIAIIRGPEPDTPCKVGVKSRINSLRGGGVG